MIIDDKKIKYIPTLDGWRAIAIICVLIAHISESKHYHLGVASLSGLGTYGVSLFFALSGYIISTHLIREMEAQRFSFKVFYVKRFFRLMPVLYAYLAIVLLLGFIGFIAPDKTGVLSSIAFIRNYIPGELSTNQVWSLSIEEHFYLLLPSFLVILKKPKRVILAIILSCLAVALWRKIGTIPWFIRNYPLTEYHPNNTFGRIDGLLYGVLAAYIEKYYPKVFKKMAIHPVIAIAAIIFTWFVHLPGQPVIRAIVFPLLFMSTLIRPENLFSKFLELKYVRYIGKISYSLYLWQQLVTYKMFKAPAIVQSFTGEWYSIVVALLIAALSFHFIETPIRNWGYKKVKAASIA